MRDSQLRLRRSISDVRRINIAVLVDRPMTKLRHEASVVNDQKKMSDHLANERTVLAWTRTGLNIFTIGCAVARFGGPNDSQASLTNPTADKKPVISGIILAACGLLCLLYGLYRFVQTHRRINGIQASPNPDIIGPIIAILFLTAALIAVVVVFFII